MIVIKEFKIEEYNPFEKTAIRRKKISKPMQLLLNKGLLQGRCLDYACGNGEDFILLWKEHIDIEGYDAYNTTYKNDKLLNNTYDTITCLYMFNVIPSIEEHKRQLDILKSLSKGNIYIAIRSDEKAINPQTWRFINEYDGWVTSNNSFQRFYTINEMIKNYFGSVIYIHNGKDFKLFKLDIQNTNKTE